MGCSAGEAIQRLSFMVVSHSPHVWDMGVYLRGGEDVSFSRQVKDELERQVPAAVHCQLAELLAMAQNFGRRIDTADGPAFQIQTENLTVARKSYILTRKVFHVKMQVTVRRNRSGRRVGLYFLQAPAGKPSLSMLFRLGWNETDGTWEKAVREKLLARNCCQRAYLRGMFLSTGSMADPRKSYHLEMVLPEENEAKELIRRMEKFSVEARMIPRKHMFVVYLKEGAQIVDLLNVMGAHVALMDLENVRILKDVRNQVNRKVNCETANLQKTVDAAARAKEDILLIQQKMGLEKLSEGLFEIATLRLQEPDASLQELGAMLDPPIGKSGVNHRLRKLGEIADRLRQHEKEEM